jgi:hypothetical protein
MGDVAAAARDQMNMAVKDSVPGNCAHIDTDIEAFDRLVFNRMSSRNRPSTSSMAATSLPLRSKWSGTCRCGRTSE